MIKKMPASAFRGVDDPSPNLKLPCMVCGNKDTKVLSMPQMMMLRHHPVDANTFLIPNKAWGYIQCAACETKENEAR